MDNEVTIKVTAKSDVRQGFEAAKRDAENAGKDLGQALGGKISDEFMEKMRRAFGELPAKEKAHVTQAGKKIGDDLADAIERATDNIKVFATGRAKVAGLGDQTEHIKVKVDVDEEHFGDRLKAMFRKVIPDSLSGALSGMKGHDLMAPLITGLVVSLAPLLAGALADAVALAVGGGVLAGGIALAADNPAVRSAFGELRDHLMDKSLKPLEDNVTKAKAKLKRAEYVGSEKGILGAEYDLKMAEQALAKAREFNRLNESLRDMASVFVAPLARAAKTLADGVDRMKPDIKELFQTMAPVLDKLTPGLVGLFEKMMPGVKKITEASVPLFETLSEYLPIIGDALGDFFTKIADHGDEANVFFGDLLDAVVTLIDFLGSLITTFLKMYTAARRAALIMTSVFVTALEKILHAAVVAFGWVPGLGPKLRAAEREFTKFKNQVNGALAGIKDRDVKIRVSAVGVAAAKAAIQGAAIIARSMGRAHGGVVGAAAGGARDGLTWVGEEGPELVSLPAGSTVHTAGDSRRIAAAAGGQGGPIVIQMIPTVGPGLINELMRSLRIEIGNQGGNVQTVLGRA